MTRATSQVLNCVSTGACGRSKRQKRCTRSQQVGCRKTHSMTKRLSDRSHPVPEAGTSLDHNAASVLNEPAAERCPLRADCCHGAEAPEANTPRSIHVRSAPARRPRDVKAGSRLPAVAYLLLARGIEEPTGETVKALLVLFAPVGLYTVHALGLPTRPSAGALLCSRRAAPRIRMRSAQGRCRA